MSFELPTDLIQQVQISLRNAAGLSNYNWTHPSPLSSLESSISEFDPSPPYLRCKHCKGRLLRGLQSIICVYCGNKQIQNEVATEPISFTSTVGYRWFLESLDLEESERVGASVEFSRGKNTPTMDISLSELLDLKIRWPAEWEKPETSVTSKTVDQSKNTFNLTGVELDNFFSGERRDSFLNASPEQQEISKPIGSGDRKVFVSQDNLSLFPNAQPSEMAIRSSEHNSGDAFSGWQADFQSGGSGNEHESFKSLDPFIGSTVDLYTGKDSPLGTAEDIKHESVKDDSAPSPVTNAWPQNDEWSTVPSVVLQQSEQVATIIPNDDLAPLSATNDWVSDDLWNNTVSVISKQAEQFDGIVKAEEGLTFDNVNDQPSTSIDWIAGDQWRVNSINAGTVGEHDDSHDAWDEFTSSTNAQDPSKDAWTQSGNQTVAVNVSYSQRNGFSSNSNYGDTDFGSFLQPDLFPASSNNQNRSAEETDILSEFTASDRIADGKSEVGEESGLPGMSGDVFSTTAQPKDDVEMLLSQMHDLSFMLESNLSVPSISDNLDSFPQD